MKKSLIIGVMGGGEASRQTLAYACELGERIAENGWILLNGGRKAGVMAASAQGAAARGGLTIGILPDDNPAAASEHIAIPILTGLGNARNCINVLSSNVVVACPGGAGTLSEIALALKNNRPVITMGFYLGEIPGIYLDRRLLHAAETPAEVIDRIKKMFPR